MSTGSSPKASDLDIRPYIRVLVRRKWIIVIITLLATGSAFFLANQQTPRYRSTAELLFKSSSADLLSQNAASSPANGVRGLASEIKVLKGQAVRARVTEGLGSAPTVKVSEETDAGVIAISAESSDSRRAADIANAYARAYIDHRAETTLNEVSKAQSVIQAKIDQVRGQVDEKTRQIAIAPPGAGPGLESERQALLSQEFGFRQQFSQLQFRADLSGGGVEVVTEAGPAPTPFEPAPRRSAALAGSLGFLFALGLAFFVDFLDDSIQTKEDLERAAPGVPLLGSIPASPRSKQPQILSLEEPSSPFAEAFRTLRTSIQFMSLDEPVRMLQVTSPAAGEGKSTTVSNLAVAFARAGRRVVVVDCDLRRPRVRELFNVSGDRGFTSVLLGESSISDALADGPSTTMKVLPAGSLPPNPSELLSSRKAAEVLEVIKSQSDYVLVDSPPVLPVSDAAVLSKLVDGTICVVSVGQTTRRQLHRTVEILAGLNTKLIGIVLNGVTVRSSDYGSSYGYAGPSRANRPDVWWRRGGRREGTEPPSENGSSGVSRRETRAGDKVEAVKRPQRLPSSQARRD